MTMTATGNIAIAGRCSVTATLVVLCCLLGSAAANAAWFKNPEQQAAQKFEQGEYSNAANEFADDYRRGIALYRSGRYTDAGEAFSRVEREEVKADALYNLGNTRYKRSDFAGAVDAYNASLELRADDEDVLHNLALAKKMLEPPLTEEEQEDQEEQEEQEEETEETQQQQESEESSGEEEQESEESSGEEEQESEESSGEQEQESESSSGDQEQESEASSGDQEQESEGSSGEQEQESEASSGDQEQESEASSGDQEQESEGSSGDQEQESKASTGDQEQESGQSAGEEKPKSETSSGDEDQVSESSGGDQESDSDSGEEGADTEQDEHTDVETGSEENSIQKQGDLEGDADSGEPAVENSDSLGKDNFDKGSGSEQGTATGDEREERKDTGSTAEQTAGPRGIPEEISAEEATASQAVEQFDQMGAGQGDVDTEDPATGQADENALPGTGVSMIMMEQWLDRIEGDPAFLLRNQFLIEEQRQLEKRGGALMESRPW